MTPDGPAAGDYGPQRSTTIHLPEGMWRAVRGHAVEHGVTASAIIDELVAGYLDATADERAAIALRSTRWMRPRGGAATRDIDPGGD